MTERNDGGPAFPLAVAVSPSDDLQCSADVSGGIGMSLRDYFASASITGVLRRDGAFGRTHKCDIVARMAYEMADAMLAQRAKT